MNYKMLFAFTYLFGIHDESYRFNQCSGEVTNPDNFFGQYVTACGFGYLCNNGLENSTGLNVPRNLGPCPSCSCDNDCFSRNECCPDKLFTRPWTACESTSINSLYETYLVKYPLIGKCPVNALHEDTLSCYDPDNRITASTYQYRHIPVNSNRTQLSYKNIFCALCHAEDPADLDKWDIYISNSSCEPEVYNIESSFSFSELADHRLHTFCDTWYIPKSYNVVPQCSSKDKIIYNDCNITGTWTAFNVDIYHACRSGYGPSFRLYSNIFCFMCNPPSRQHIPLISSCNSNILNTMYGSDLITLCNKQELSSITFPYKNVFCYLCHLVMKDDLLHKPFSATDNEFLLGKSVVYTYKNIRLNNLDHVVKKRADVSLELPVFYDKTSLVLNGVHYNLSSLLLTKVLSSLTNICNKNLLPRNIRNLTTQNCDCDPKCLFTNKCTCCVDVSISYPLECLTSLFVVTNGCYGDKHIGKPYFSTIKFLCESNTVYGSLPVVFDGIDYKNIFCYICNSDYKVVNDTLVVPSGYYIRDTIITCAKTIPLSYSVTFDDILTHARNSRCKFTFDTKDDTPRGCVQYHRQRCDLSPDVPIELFEVCHTLSDENLYPYAQYKNEICYICDNYDRRKSLNDTIQTCSAAYGNTSLASVCYDLPMSQSDIIFPYKNSFCKLCNQECFPNCHFDEPSPPVPDCLGDVSAIGIVDPPSLRQVFGIPVEEISINQEESHVVLNYTQMFDRINMLPGFLVLTNRDSSLVCWTSEHKYRSITCFPGRMLTPDGCKVRDMMEKVGEYVFMVKTVGRVINKNNYGSKILSTLEIFFRNEMAVFLRNERYFLREIRMYSDVACKSVYSKASDTIVNYTIFTKITISPLDIIYTLKGRLENELISINNKILNKTVFTLCGQNEKCLENVPLYSVEYSSKKFLALTHMSFCRYEHESKRLSFHTPITYITEQLTCRHVEFTMKECIVDEQNGILSIRSPSMTLYPGMYLIRRGDTVSFCLDRLLAYSFNVPSVNQPVDKTLRMLTLICSLTSLVCLCLTFMTYCKFAILRTLPGKNLMALVFNLFVAQFIFIMGNNMIENQSLCKIIGVLQHLFWLAMLFSFIVTCFHMFRVFNTMQCRQTFPLRTFIKYIIFIYSVPVGIIGLSIVTSLLIYDDMGYGGQMCFISHEYLRWSAFIFPILLTMFLDSLFLALSMYRIMSTRKVSSSNQERNNLFIFFKLFAISGGLWGFQILDAFLDLSMFSYVISVLNSFQGLFIFISFVLNKRTLKLIVHRNAPLSENTSSSNKEVRRPCAINDDIMNGNTVYLNTEQTGVTENTHF